jgi:hypothetical protein
MKHSWLVTLVALSSAPAFAQSVWVAPATAKVRPTTASGTNTSIALEAARNEFEAFHVVVNGGSAGAAAVTVTADALSDGNGNTISDVRVYREAWINVATISNIQGATGRWPDALIPAVDEIDNQPRNAFPYNVPANEQQPMFIEYHVSATAPAGWYSGSVHVTGGVTVDVPVKIYVHAFTLPSTASIRTAFGIGWQDPCIAHYGSYTACGGDAGAQAMLTKYARFALDHRVSLSDVVYTGPAANTDGSYDWATWDATYGAMLNGGMGGRLVGAQLTSVRYQWTLDQAHYAEWAKHFRAQGWFDRTFDYTCDEPPNGCAWSAIPTRAAMVHGADAGFETLVTTTYAQAAAAGVASSIDTLVPVVDFMDPMPPSSNTRATYDAFLATSAQKRLWMYQSCDSHGCNGPGGALTSGWPSYMIDAPATQNRAMEWQAWRERVSGELYYDTTYAFSRGDAWTNQYYFAGNGDGTLFYPGTPAKIGGTSQVPIASLRLKMIREGQEDYEYLKMLSDSGDAAMADSEAQGLSPDAYTNMTDPASIDAARHRIALRIEALTGATAPAMGATPPDSSSAGGATTPGGASSDGSSTTGGTAASGTSASGTSAAGGGSGGGCSLAGQAATTPAAILEAGLALLALVAFGARRRVRQAVRIVRDRR